MCSKVKTQYISQSSKIQIDWTVKKGIGFSLEDFTRSAVSLFLIGAGDRVSVACEAGLGTVTAEVVEGLDEGVYSLELLWVKNGDIHGTRCLQRSRIDKVFCITRNASEAQSQDTIAKVKVTTHAQPYGYDGLSAYEAAVLRGYRGSENAFYDAQGGGGSDIPAEQLAMLEEMYNMGVMTNRIADLAVTDDKIAAGAVTTEKIATGAVTTDKIASGAITSAKIGTSQVATYNLASGSVVTSKLGAKSVTNAKLDNKAVTSSKIANFSIVEAHLAESLLNKFYIGGEDVTESYTANTTGAARYQDCDGVSYRVLKGSSDEPLVVVLEPGQTITKVSVSTSSAALPYITFLVADVDSSDYHAEASGGGGYESYTNDYYANKQVKIGFDRNYEGAWISGAVVTYTIMTPGVKTSLKNYIIALEARVAALEDAQGE